MVLWLNYLIDIKYNQQQSNSLAIKQYNNIKHA